VPGTGSGAGSGAGTAGGASASTPVTTAPALKIDPDVILVAILF
jgi:hypothetical protein